MKKNLFILGFLGCNGKGRLVIEAGASHTDTGSIEEVDVLNEESVDSNEEVIDEEEPDTDSEIENEPSAEPESSPNDADEDGFDASVDCDDSNPAINPSAGEVCDGVDNDCDGQIDEAGAAGEQSFYADADGDGYGAASEIVDDCSQPTGYVGNPLDCDDTDFNINPSVGELCDGLDNDCDGVVDSSTVCPCDVESYNGHSYLFCDSPQTWYGALSSCVAQSNYQLVVIDDSAEQAWVWTEANARAGDLWWWTGYHDDNAADWQEPGDGWEWVDGSNSGYSNWAGGQPDNYNWNEDCAHIYGDNGTWNDLQCDIDNWYGSSVYYICEAP